MVVSRRRVLGMALAVVALVGLAACQPRRALWSPSAGWTYGAAVVSRDGADSYALTTSGSGIHAEALATNAGGNTRIMVWPRGVAAVTDGESCASWTGRDGEIVQQGAVLRVLRQGSRVRAVTVTQNVTFVQWTFNVHTWDTSRADAPHRLVGQIVMKDTFFAGGIPPFPWHLCARAVGDVVSFKLWAGTAPEPRWGDGRAGGSVRLPAGWRFPGQTGWYVGHLKAGDHADFDDLSLWTYDPAADRVAPLDGASRNAPDGATPDGTTDPVAAGNVDRLRVVG